MEEARGSDSAIRLMSWNSECANYQFPAIGDGSKIEALDGVLLEWLDATLE